MSKWRFILSFVCLVGFLSLSQSVRANDFLDYVVTAGRVDSLSISALLNMRFSPTYVADNHLRTRHSYGTLYGSQVTNIYAPQVPMASEPATMGRLHIHIAPPKGRLSTSNPILPQARVFTIQKPAPQHVYYASDSRPLRTGTKSVPVFAKPPSTGGGDPVITPPDVWNTPLGDGVGCLAMLLMVYMCGWKFSFFQKWGMETIGRS